MREVKFRAYDSHNNKWVYGYLTKLVEGIRKFWAIIQEEEGEESLVRYYIHNEESVGQYTGRTDSNGTELYEGDIISDHVGIGTIEYVDRHAAFRVNYQDGRAKWFYDYTLKGEPESIEKIGNIHEDSHLIK